MTAKRYNGTDHTDLTTQKRWDGSSWVDLTIGKRWSGTAWEDVLSGGGGTLTATVSPGFARGTVTDFTSPPLSVGVSSNIVTVSAVGGTSPYTYTWTKVSGDTVTISDPTSASTQFSGTLFRNEVRQAVYRCTVRDTLGDTITVDVNVFLQYVAS